MQNKVHNHHFYRRKIPTSKRKKRINKQDAYCVQIETMISSISSTLTDTKDGLKDTKLFLNIKVSTRSIKEGVGLYTRF